MAATPRTTSQHDPAPGAGCPPLESGDRLTSVEFERRYRQHPEIRRAELIEGVVYVASPMRHVGHSRPQHIVSTWLGVYESGQQDVEGGAGGTVRLDADNNVQPDAFLRHLDGTSKVSDDDYLEGPPEFVFEIAGSSATIDLGPKLGAYRRNGVKEYVVWQVWDKRVDWFELTEEGQYERREPGADGIIESRAFPGLRLAVDRLVEEDLAGVLAAQQG